MSDGYDFVVAADGSGDFETVQAAVDAVPDFRESETAIFVRAGTYDEKLVVPSTKTNVTLVGEDPEGTVLTHGDHARSTNRFGEERGTTGSSSCFLFGDGFTARDVTFRNHAEPVAQAVAARVDGDRAAFENCRFVGDQDTLYTHGRESRQYYRDCHVEGDVDFVFGSSTAVFDDCEIRCKEDGGYVTAASTPEWKDFGYVFRDCAVRAGEGADPDSYYLGRPWRPHARTVFLDTYLGDQIRPEGWHNWDDPAKEETAFYAEYGNEGPGFTPTERVDWARQLSDEEAAEYTLGNVFGDWDPEAQLDAAAE